MESDEMTIERLEKEKAAMREAIIELNKALDDYWNGARSDDSVKLICAWQQHCKQVAAA